MKARSKVHLVAAVALAATAAVAACLQPQPLPPEAGSLDNPKGNGFGDDGSPSKPSSDGGTVPISNQDAGGNEPTDSGDAGDAGESTDAGDAGESTDAGDGGS